MKNVSKLFIALSLATLAGCPGDDGGSGDTETTLTPTTTMTPTGGDDGGATMADDDGGATMADDDGGATMADDGGATMADDTAGDTAGDSGTGGGGGAGSCAETCKAPTDCAAGTGTKETYACTDGFCEFIGDPIDPCDPAVCPEAAGYICATIDGNDVCGLACPNGDECDVAMQECVMDDKATAVCQFPDCFGAGEGEPCELTGVGQIGTCSGGVCGCTDDAECTIAGQACQAG
jgi:hypothetical protein